jgi:putative MATE family efflux protein
MKIRVQRMRRILTGRGTPAKTPRRPEAKRTRDTLPPVTEPIQAREPAAEPEGIEGPEKQAGILAGIWAELRYRDHTSGSLALSTLVLSLPAILTSLAGGGVYQLVDLYFIGQLGPVATAAVGATNQVMRQFAFLLTFGTALGAQMLVARLVGAGRMDQAEHVAGQVLVTAAGICILIALLGLFPEALLALLTTDPEVVVTGAPYVQLTFFLMFGQVFGMMVSFILTGAGETTTPMIISLVTTPIAIFAEWCLIFGHFGLPALGVAGVAIGVAISSAVGLALLLWVVLTGRCRIRLRLRHLVPDPASVRQIVGVSWQPALHLLARTSMVFFFMALAGYLGTNVQAAYTIGLRIEMVPILIAFPIANACSTLVGQNLARGDVARAWRSIWVATGMSVGALSVIAVVLFLLRESFVSAFSEDPEVIAVASEYLAFACAILVLHGLYFVAFRALQGAGDMNSPMVISIAVAATVGAPSGYYLATQTGLGPTGMWIGNLLYCLVNTLLMYAWLLLGRWARRPV